MTVQQLFPYQLGLRCHLYGNHHSRTLITHTIKIYLIILKIMMETVDIEYLEKTIYKVDSQGIVQPGGPEVVVIYYSKFLSTCTYI